MKLSWSYVPAALAAFVLACACSKSASTGSSTAASGTGTAPDRVVATFNGGKITAGELEKEARPQIAELENKMYQARKQALEQMAMERIVKAEAAKAGLTEQDYIRKRVEEAPVQQPTEAQERQFYDRLKSAGQIPPEATFESLKDRIGQALINQQRQGQMQKVIADLQKQANLKLDLPQPRISVAAEGPTRGPKDAPVTIVEFSDFECPYCGSAHDTVEQVMNAYAGKVRLVYRQFPLSFHPRAAKAAEASLCAGDQGKFWEYHDVLFKNQKKLEPTDLKAHATEVGLDAQKFGQCLDSGDKKKTVDADQQAGLAAGVGGTPAFFINGIFLNGAQPLDEFKKVIDGELASK
ncbi:MAG TPA: thioredoxin domain-containing protein [Myxococcaceae bacterium]|nr:thioredoxin domain-containing protein [Myxococcaceae bacterium]